MRVEDEKKTIPNARLSARPAPQGWSGIPSDRYSAKATAAAGPAHRRGSANRKAASARTKRAVSNAPSKNGPFWVWKRGKGKDEKTVGHALCAAAKGRRGEREEGNPTMPAAPRQDPRGSRRRRRADRRGASQGVQARREAWHGVAQERFPTAQSARR